MLAEGEGCERDLAAAREWLRRSVAGGYEHAEGWLRIWMQWTTRQPDPTPPLTFMPK